jgi:chromosome segregation ATPase
MNDETVAAHCDSSVDATPPVGAVVLDEARLLVLELVAEVQRLQEENEQLQQQTSQHQVPQPELGLLPQRTNALRGSYSSSHEDKRVASSLDSMQRNLAARNATIAKLEKSLASALASQAKAEAETVEVKKHLEAARTSEALLTKQLSQERAARKLLERRVEEERTLAIESVRLSIQTLSRVQHFDADWREGQSPSLSITD